MTETDAEFRFLMDGQSVVIEDYLAIRPEARERLDRAVSGGRIEVGPWYTLPDEFLVSAETLVRNLERGIAVGDAHGGAMRVGYLPDSFGHAAQMPQIYAQFEFRHAVVWRGVPSAIDRLAFTWESPDSSRILTAYMGTSYSHGVDLPTSGPALAARITATLQALEPFQPAGDVLLMNGNDHVLPQHRLTAAVREANEHLAGDRVTLGRLQDYLARLMPADWPHWQGELRASSRANVLMGTLSVRVPDKQAYFRASRALERYAEPLSAITGVDADGFLREAWTLVLQNAAHDTACGSGIDAVADESRVRSRSAQEIAEAVTQLATAKAARSSPDRQFFVWNPSPFPRQALVEIETEAIPAGAQDLGPATRPPLRRALLQTGLIGGCAFGPVTPRAASPIRATQTSLENDLVRCSIAPDGTLSLLDLQRGTRYGGVHRFVDEADAGDEYNYSPPGTDEPPVVRPEAVLDVRLLEAGPLRGKLQIDLVYRVPRELSHDRRSRTAETVEMPISVEVSLATGQPQLDFNIRLVNQAKDHRLRVHVPLPFPVSHSDADTPYHVTRRAVIPPRHEPGAPEWELPTYPMRSFVDASDATQGVTLITEGLHEYEVMAGPPQVLALTLLRAVGWLSRDDLRFRSGHAGPMLPTPGAQLQGAHQFRYSLRVHAGEWEGAGAWRAAESTLLPFLVFPAGSLAGPPPAIELEPETVQLCALIPRRYGYELRLVNASHRPQPCALRIEPVPTEITRVTLGGEVRGRVASEEGRFRFAIRPWEIATLRVKTSETGASLAATPLRTPSLGSSSEAPRPGEPDLPPAS